MSGRSLRSTASIAAAATSARITMPGPPPAGVSSTVRCLPRPWSRMSRTSSDQRSFSSALPNREMPSGPGNISGKRVRTVADQLLDMVVVFVIFRYSDDNITSFDIQHRHRLAAEDQMHIVAIGADEFDHVAGAEIVEGGDLAQHAAIAVARFQPNQVGVIEFVFLGFGQHGAVHEQFRALQGFSLIAVADPLKGNHRLALFGGAKGGDDKLA